MSSAREILDERLARGEISPDEHATLAARLSTAPAAAPAAERGTPTGSFGAPGKGSMIWNVMGLVVAGGWVLLTNGVVQNLITACVQRGGTAASCNASVINWPMVYGSYGIAVLIGVSAVVSLLAAKKNA